MLTAGWGSQISILRRGNPGGLITRRAVSMAKQRLWPKVQINPPLLPSKNVLQASLVHCVISLI